MAEGLWRDLAGAAWHADSAGSHPAGSVHPLAVRVMNEVGIDISAQQSKPVALFAGERFDLIVTVCDRARQTCPLPPDAVLVEHWSLPDPAAAAGSEDTRLATFRTVRDLLRKRILAQPGLADPDTCRRS